MDNCFHKQKNCLQKKGKKKCRDALEKDESNG